MSKILVTGAAGFIGSHLCKALLERGHQVVGIDNLDPLTSLELKQARLATLISPRWEMRELDILDANQLLELVSEVQPNAIIHLAAKAGVRASIDQPTAYFSTNVIGSLNVLETARGAGVEKVMIASSSSVYGNQAQVPFSESEVNLQPISPYAASKLALEIMARNYHLVYKTPIQLFRFFTVYGPAGRPDMAPALFASAIMQEKPLTIFGGTSSQRDYTYIDDIVAGLIRALERNDEFAIYNLGNSHPEPLSALIEALEAAIGKKAQLNIIEKQPGDVERTWADVSLAQKNLLYKPEISLNDGIARFIDWLKQENNIRYYKS